MWKIKGMAMFWLGLLVQFAVSAEPLAKAGFSQTVLDREGDGVETVVLDGSASTGMPVLWKWKEGTELISTNSLCLATFPTGTHTVSLTVEDDQGKSNTDTLDITVTPLSGRKQRLNLRDEPKADRFPRPRTLVWPANPGEADICLWKDDMFAALSITIDDNLVGDHEWWIEQGNKYGWRFTWYVISGMIDGYNRGPWSKFQTLADLGHDVQSHSVNHHSNDDVLPIGEVIPEYRDSIAAIEANVTGVKVVSIGWPYGKFNRDVAALYVTSARGVFGTPNKPERTDYLNASSCSASIGEGLIDSVLYGTSTVSWLSGGVYLRGWYSCHYHTIKNRAATEADFDYIAAHGTNLWVGLFKDVAFYGQERDTATLSITENSSSQIAFTLSDEMDDTLFTYPLTVKVKLYPDWTAVQAVQNGATVSAQIVTNSGALYALVQAVPDQGEVSLTPGL